MTDLSYERYQELCLKLRDYLEGECSATFEKIQEYMGLDIRTTRKILGRLQAEGYIHIGAQDENGAVLLYAHKNTGLFEIV